MQTIVPSGLVIVRWTGKKGSNSSAELPHALAVYARVWKCHKNIKIIIRVTTPLVSVCGRKWTRSKFVHNSSNNVPFEVWAAGVLGVGSGLLQTDSSATGSRIV